MALKKLFEKEEYFFASRKAVLEGFSTNSELQKLKDYSLKAAKILDCGCGDGTLIEMLWKAKGEFWGVDLSTKAIKIGRERLKNKKNIRLRAGDLEKLDFEKENFDLVFTSNVLEHLNNPEKVIEEMIRVTKKGGCLIFVSANYGSPLYPSPSSPPPGETLISRAIKIFLKSHFYLLKRPQGLEWLKVTPLALREKRWEPDWDTVVEPSLQTLLILLKGQGVEVVESYSLPSGLSVGWSGQGILSILKKGTLVLGKMRLPPYKFFGPILFVVGRKR